MKIAQTIAGLFLCSCAAADIGAAGANGQAGAQGPVGAQGPPGPPGADGALVVWVDADDRVISPFTSALFAGAGDVIWSFDPETADVHAVFSLRSIATSYFVEAECAGAEYVTANTLRPLTTIDDGDGMIVFRPKTLMSQTVDEAGPFSSRRSAASSACSVVDAEDLAAIADTRVLPRSAFTEVTDAPPILDATPPLHLEHR